MDTPIILVYFQVYTLLSLLSSYYWIDATDSADGSVLFTWITSPIGDWPSYAPVMTVYEFIFNAVADVLAVGDVRLLVLPATVQLFCWHCLCYAWLLYFLSVLFREVCH